jgi:hypothetical protein
VNQHGMNYMQVHQNWQFWYGPTTYTPSPRTPKELADAWRRLPFFCKSTGSLLSSRGALGVFLPKGHAEYVPPVGWKLVQQLDALGHRLDSSADSKPCMMRTISMAWAAFWKNYNMVSRALGLSSRCRLFQRAVSLVVRFRCPRWIWQISAAKTLKQQQSRMLGSLMSFAPEAWRVLQRAG